MNTNFPDFSSSQQDQFDFTPYATEQPTTPQPKTSEMERFWTITGNWGEFGLYFGLGLCGSLIVRAIPALAPSGVIVSPAVVISLGLMAVFGPEEGRLKGSVILVALAAAMLAGNWDAWLAWVITNAWKITGLVLISAGIAGHFFTGGKRNV